MTMHSSKVQQQLHPLSSFWTGSIILCVGIIIGCQLQLLLDASTTTYCFLGGALLSSSSLSSSTTTATAAAPPSVVGNTTVHDHETIDRMNNRDDSDNQELLYELAYNESYGFFDNVREDEWMLLKQRVQSVHPNVLLQKNVVDRTIPVKIVNTKRGKIKKHGYKTINITLDQLRKTPIAAKDFFQDHYEPNFACQHEHRMGRLGDGGKWVCDPHRLKQKQDCLVYSIGSHGDVSFERAVQDQIGRHCEIHVFDIVNYSNRVNSIGGGVQFHHWGISNTTSTDARGRHYKTLQQTYLELGHSGRTIDIFKIDCEGCEWSIYPSLFGNDDDHDKNKNPSVRIQQLLIELHSVHDGKGKINYHMPIPQSFDFLTFLQNHGYVLFHKEVNIKYWHFGQCSEYAFLKLHEDFFR